MNWAKNACFDIEMETNTVPQKEARFLDNKTRSEMKKGKLTLFGSVISSKMSLFESVLFT